MDQLSNSIIDWLSRRKTFTLLTFPLLFIFSLQRTQILPINYKKRQHFNSFPIAMAMNWPVHSNRRQLINSGINSKRFETSHPWNVALESWGRSRPKVPTHRFFLNLLCREVMIYFCQKGKKKNGGSPTSFWKEHAPKITLNLKNRASLANKATVSVRLKILQLDLWSEMFFVKFCLSGPIKWIQSTGEVP